MLWNWFLHSNPEWVCWDHIVHLSDFWSSCCRFSFSVEFILTTFLIFVEFILTTFLIFVEFILPTFLLLLNLCCHPFSFWGFSVSDPWFYLFVSILDLFTIIQTITESHLSYFLACCKFVMIVGSQNLYNISLNNIKLFYWYKKTKIK